MFSLSLSIYIYIYMSFLLVATLIFTKFSIRVTIVPFTVANETKVTHQTYMILLIAASIGLLFAFTAVCLLLCKKLFETLR